MKKALAFFGAFNPPTTAHLELARYALEQTGRETVVFVPSRSAYIREEQGKDYAYSDRARLAMLRAAREKRPWMAVTDYELTLDLMPAILGSDKMPSDSLKLYRDLIEPVPVESVD